MGARRTHWSRSAARVQKVQRVLPASSGRVQRVWYRRFAAMSFYMLPAGGKSIHNRASPVEMHPYSSAGTLHGGEICSMLSIYLIQDE